MKVIIVTPLHPLNKFNGSSQRINRIIYNLNNSGFETIIIYTCQDLGLLKPPQYEKLISMLKREYSNAFLLPSEVKIINNGKINKLDDFFPHDILREFKKIVFSIKPSCVLVNYVFLSGLLEHIPNSIYKIIDVHDKLSRADIYKSAELNFSFFCTTEKEELRGLKRADLVIGIQENESNYFKKSGLKNIITIGHSIEKSYMNKKSFKTPRKLGFIGSNHIFNAKSVEKLLSSRRFIDLKKDFKFIFAGNICNNKIVNNSGAVLIGLVDKIVDFYSSIDLVLNPVIFGTGLKIKTVEALSYGLPVVGTKVAFDGISTESPFHLAKNIDQIYDLLEKIRHNPGIIVNLSNLSRSLFEDYIVNVRKGYQDLINQISSYAKTKVPLNKSVDNIAIHHIINAVEASKDSDLYLAQPITFKSLNIAKAYFTTTQSVNVKVKHHIVLVNNEKCNLNLLNKYKVHRVFRTIRDFPGFESFKSLPLLQDILCCVGNKNDNDYIVFSNVDISLTPIFYEFVYEKIKTGYDAIVINRRTLSKIYSKPDEYHDMVADLGDEHPGYDCFVFKVTNLKNFYLSNTIIGVHLIGRVLLWNIIKYSKNPLILSKSHLTFHIGDDNAGKDENNNSLFLHNFNSALVVLEKLYDESFKLRIEGLAPNALKFNYSPNIFRDRIKEKKWPIFIHSMFRTGSTYIWDKFNKHREITCYYEPLHEMLNGLTEENLKFQVLNTDRYHNRLKKINYWENYRNLIKKEQTGVRLYQKRYAYFDYTNTSENDYGLKKYILELIKNAGNMRSAFQFNRSSLRQKWFLKEFPESINIYLLREARAQFNSYYNSFLNTNGRGFVRTNLSIIDQNVNSEFFKDIKKILQMPEANLDHTVSIKKYFETYDDHVKKYNIKQLYLMFFWHWLQSLISALKSGSEIFNMNEITNNILYRRKKEYFLASKFIYINFDDCSLPEIISGNLHSDDYDNIEREVVLIHRKILSKYISTLQENKIINVLSAINSSSKCTSNKSLSEYVSSELNINSAEKEKVEPITVPLSALKCNGQNVSINNDKKNNTIKISGALNIKIPIEIRQENKYKTIIVFISVKRKNFENITSPFLSLSINGKRYRKILTNILAPIWVEDLQNKRDFINLDLLPENENTLWNISSVGYKVQ